MSEETLAGLGAFAIAAGFLILIGIVLMRLDERKHKKQSPKVVEHTPPVAMPGMEEPHTQPLSVFEVYADAFLDEIDVMPVVQDYERRPSLPGREAVKQQISRLLKSIGECEDE
jgi:hypothetical protein